jgi:hypothetical protein
MQDIESFFDSDADAIQNPLSLSIDRRAGSSSRRTPSTDKEKCYQTYKKDK